MSSRKDALMEELVMHMEVRGELGPEGNAATEKRIAEIEKELNMPESEVIDTDNYFTLWKTGYRVQAALYVQLVGETAKAYKFKCLDSAKQYEFFMPKKACEFDRNNKGIIAIARWFDVQDFLKFLFDRYASHYNR